MTAGGPPAHGLPYTISTTAAAARRKRPAVCPRHSPHLCLARRLLRGCLAYSTFCRFGCPECGTRRRNVYYITSSIVVRAAGLRVTSVTSGTSHSRRSQRSAGKGAANVAPGALASDHTGWPESRGSSRARSGAGTISWTTASSGALWCQDGPFRSAPRPPPPLPPACPSPLPFSAPPNPSPRASALIWDLVCQVGQ